MAWSSQGVLLAERIVLVVVGAASLVTMLMVGFNILTGSSDGKAQR